MGGKTAAIIGSTGLTGSYLLEMLLSDDYFDTVRVIVRKPAAKTNPKMEVKLVDFNDAESLKLALEETNAIFCCIGTTNKKVKGDKELYRKIDFDIPIKAARFGKEAGSEKFIVVSAVGADSKSSNFYLKLKGEVEDALKTIGIKSVHIMRPSMLLGARKEFRLGERIGKALIKGFSFLLPSKYKPIHAKEVAKAMIAFAKEGKEGFFIHEYKEIKKVNLNTNLLLLAG
jgi:uncharacterized protein YbjT (DUF2867 family)